MTRHSELSKLIESAWELIGAATPLPADCGELCGAACCKDSADTGNTIDERADEAVDVRSDEVVDVRVDADGGSNELGMLLFPGEVELMRGEPGYRIKRIRYMGGHAWFLVCAGTCDRSRRPLACRIFPLAPDVRGDGSVHAAPDPRAARMCPLAGGEFIDRRFRGAVGRAFRMLSREPVMMEFMRRLSLELAELRRLML